MAAKLSENQKNYLARWMDLVAQYGWVKGHNAKKERVYSYVRFGALALTAETKSGISLVIYVRDEEPAVTAERWDTGTAIMIRASK